MRIPSFSTKSYADVVRSSHTPQSTNEPTQLRPASSDFHPLPPLIVNLDAQRLAKRRKVLDTSDEGIFKALHQSIEQHRYKAELTNEENELAARDFKQAHPELFNWIVLNGSEARERATMHGLGRNKYLANKVKELLYWLPVTTSSKKPLHPETVSALIRKHLVSGKTPQEVANELQQFDNFIFALTKLSFESLKENAREFIKDDSPYIHDLFPEALYLLYQAALDKTELFILMFELNSESELEKLLELSKPTSWSEIVKKDCSSWRDVEDFFYGACFGPVKLDMEQLRNLITKLRKLESAISFIEEPRRSQMLFLAEETPYPLCVEKLPELFNRLSVCKKEFPVSGICKTTQERYQNFCLQKKEEALNSQEAVLDQSGILKRFYSNFSEAIYKASFPILYGLLKNSWETKEPELEAALKEALEQTPDLAAKDLLSTLAESNEITEQFFYCLSVSYLNCDPTEWMQRIIASLPRADFARLEAEMKETPPGWSARSIYKCLTDMKRLPSDLTALKNEINLYQRESI